MNFKSDIPYIPNGHDLKRYTFCGGRLSARMADHGGLTHVRYFGDQRFGDTELYKNGDPISAWSQIFRCCLSIGDNLYYLEFNKTHIYPFGYSSECAFEGVVIRHELTLLNDALVYRIRIVKNPRKKKVAAAMLHMDLFTRVTKPTREWSGFTWTKKAKIFSNVVTDQYPVETNPAPAAHDPLRNNRFPNRETDCSTTRMAILSDHPLYLKHLNPVQKHNIYSECFDRECVFAVVFGHADAKQFAKRAAQLVKSAGSEADKVLNDYHALLKDQPLVQLEDPAVQSFASNSRAIMDFVKVKDIPGVIRADDYGYWMWGWDSLAHSQVFDLVHDRQFAPDLLALFKKCYDPQLGLFHQVMTNMKPSASMEFSAQCLYSLTLYGSYLVTGDRKLLEKYYDFAKIILDRAGRDEVGDTGLIRGVGIYPDDVAELEQTGDDIATMNNSIYYQALRATEALAIEMGRTEDVRDIQCRADRLLSGFHRLYDSKQGFFYDSISASDFFPRKHYPAHAILWVTPFARDLVRGREKEICRFMATHLQARHGFRLMPKWDTRYMADGNNQGYYDPFHERFYREMMKAGKNKEGVAEFFSNVSWFWNQLTVPEALSAEAENHGFTVDNLGCKFAFTTRAWYSTLINTMAGFDMDKEGIVFSPCDAPDFHIKNLTIRGCKVDLQITGNGWKIGKLLLNGKKIASPHRIPFADLKEHNKIQVIRI